MPCRWKGANRIATLSIALMWAALSAPLVAQKVEATPSQRFATSHAQWTDVDGKLKEVAQQYLDAETDQRAALRQQYIELIERANKVLPELRDAATAAYSAAPNADKQVIRVLVGVVANDVRNDRYDSASQTAQLLLEGGCDEPALHDLAGTAAYCSDDFLAAEKHFNNAQQADALSSIGRIYASDIGQANELWKAEQAFRKTEGEADDLPRVKLETSKGPLVLELYENEAPQAVSNFVHLVGEGFYDGKTFHRVLHGFMAQGGCPRGDGTGGPGYKIYCECFQEEARKHFRGTLSMAHSGRDTGGSQFFITFRRTQQLDGLHTVFGRVVEGLDVLERIQRIDPSAPGTKPLADKIIKATVLRKRDHEYQPTKVE